jgi:hypothetical protein
MRNQKKVFSPFKERLQTRRLTSGTIRRETKRPDPIATKVLVGLAKAA